MRAVCRTPSKVAARDNLEVVKGDVNDLDGVAKAIEGANYVVSVVWIKVRVCQRLHRCGVTGASRSGVVACVQLSPTGFRWTRGTSCAHCECDVTRYVSCRTRRAPPPRAPPARPTRNASWTRASARAPRS